MKKFTELSVHNAREFRAFLNLVDRRHKTDLISMLCFEQTTHLNRERLLFLSDMLNGSKTYYDLKNAICSSELTYEEIYEVLNIGIHL